MIDGLILNPAVDVTNPSENVETQEGETLTRSCHHKHPRDHHHQLKTSRIFVGDSFSSYLFLYSLLFSTTVNFSLQQSLSSLIDRSEHK